MNSFIIEEWSILGQHSRENLWLAMDSDGLVEYLAYCVNNKQETIHHCWRGLIDADL